MLIHPNDFIQHVVSNLSHHLSRVDHWLVFLSAVDLQDYYVLDVCPYNHDCNAP